MKSSLFNVLRLGRHKPLNTFLACIHTSRKQKRNDMVFDPLYSKKRRPLMQEEEERNKECTHNKHYLWFGLPHCVLRSRDLTTAHS